LDPLLAVAFAGSGWLGSGVVSLDTLDPLLAVAFAGSGWLAAGVVSLDTLDPLLAVAFAGSGWLGVGVDAVVVVAFGVSPVFDACDDCVKIRQMQRQKNR